jgi:predicted nucleotidyltransferase
MYNLVCVVPFGSYVKGQIVTDQDEILALIANDRMQYFVRVAA